ncbi:MAG: hypothetical protein ACQEVA_11495 [Myxococcota bacterium]
MAKLSPLQRVREEHGSKAELAGKVIGILERPEDELEQEFDHRIHTMSNAKLLRLWNAHQRVENEYGGKASLVEKIVSARFSGGNDDYEAKLMSFTLPKLLDVARQHKV